MPTFKMLKQSFVILCFALASGTLAHAQPLPDVATDQELFAAYCLGAYQDQARELADHPSLGSEVAEMDQQIKELFEGQISRFRGYLLARGFLSGSRSNSASMGFTLAIARGRADSMRCMARIKMCSQKLCSLQATDRSKCNGLNDCRDEEPACRSGARCTETDRLPF